MSKLSTTGQKGVAAVDGCEPLRSLHDNYRINKAKIFQNVNPEFINTIIRAARLTQQWFKCNRAHVQQKTGGYNCPQNFLYLYLQMSTPRRQCFTPKSNSKFRLLIDTSVRPRHEGNVNTKTESQDISYFQSRPIKQNKQGLQERFWSLDNYLQLALMIWLSTGTSGQFLRSHFQKMQ